MTEPLDSLLVEAWQAHDRARRILPEAVPPYTAPVLWFGNSEAYLTSPLKVLTVGRNPSHHEFPTDDPWGRLPSARSREGYRPALDGYFRERPLASWFRAWRELLHGLDACFWDDRPSTALHTDLCSPVPTSPTWSRLSQRQQAELVVDGVPLWHRLVNALAPDVVVFGVAYRAIDQVSFDAEGDWTPLHTVQRTNPYIVEGRRVRLPGGAPTLLVRGRAANTPFGSVKNVDRFEIGRSVRAALATTA
ncbi:MAG: hypothetical protein JWP82_926 [Humibacillus sp.]|nr:hypothetical protein [Humibacillus sp.]